MNNNNMYKLLHYTQKLLVKSQNIVYNTFNKTALFYLFIRNSSILYVIITFSFATNTYCFYRG